MKVFASILLILTCTASLNAQYEEIDLFIENEMLIGHIPGLSACMVKGWQVVWSGDYGTANFEQNVPVTTQTLFTIASLSKLFVDTGIVQLYENGQLDLDNDINLFCWKKDFQIYRKRGDVLECSPF